MLASELIIQIQKAINEVGDVPISVITGLNNHTLCLDIEDVGIESGDLNIFIGVESIK